MKKATFRIFDYDSEGRCTYSVVPIFSPPRIINVRQKKQLIRLFLVLFGMILLMIPFLGPLMSDALIVGFGLSFSTIYFVGSFLILRKSEFLDTDLGVLKRFKSIQKNRSWLDLNLVTVGLTLSLIVFLPTGNLASEEFQTLLYASLVPALGLVLNLFAIVIKYQARHQVN